jgi:hypothetical protein
MIKRAQLELPPEVARRFFEDMRAFHRERNPIKADEIATRQLVIRERWRPGRLCFERALGSWLAAGFRHADARAHSMGS